MSIVGLIAGDFGKGDPDDPNRPHRGHVDHIIKAAKLCDFLIIVTHPDDGIVRRKGYTPDPLSLRLQRLKDVLRANHIAGLVTLAKDNDGSVVMTLETLQPDRFIKGGDRTPDNMPPAEVAICKKYGIEIVYGVGDRLGQSRDIAKGTVNSGH
jgi:bifunctional ADP-heptose synthase (sugar kinase/adenylyltransferase)